MEEMNNKLKIFISYSHHDEKPFVEEFKKHLAPLKDKGLVEEWYDRKILPGEDYHSKADITRPNQLKASDIPYIKLKKDDNLVISTIENALSKHKKPEIFNSDQTSQYTSNRVIEGKKIF